MSDKTTEYAACHFLEGRIMGSRTRYMADEGTAGKHRITREGDTVIVEQLYGEHRVYEVPRVACILERKPAPKEAKK